MSKFYGSLSSDDKPSVTRCGHSQISTSAQSWMGSVLVRLYPDTTNDHIAVIGVGERSTAGIEHTLYNGPLSALTQAYVLVPMTRAEHDAWRESQRIPF